VPARRQPHPRDAWPSRCGACGPPRPLRVTVTHRALRPRAVAVLAPAAPPLRRPGGKRSCVSTRHFRALSRAACSPSRQCGRCARRAGRTIGRKISSRAVSVGWRRRTHERYRHHPRRNG
jgi:hypothetical protein